MVATKGISEQEFSLISKIGHEIISTLEINEVIERVYSNVNKLFDAKIFAVGIFDQEQQQMEVWGVRDKTELALIGKQYISDNKYWLSYCFNEQKEIFVNDYSADTSDKFFSNSLFQNELETRKSFIYIPLSLNEKRLGVLTVQSFTKNAYEKKHFQIVKNLASYVSIALQNASNFRQIKKQNAEIILNAQELEEARKNLENKVAERTQFIEIQNQTLAVNNKELERLSLVAKHTENAIMIMDAEGSVLWVNDYFTHLYEYSYEQFTSMRGKNIRDTSFNPEIEIILSRCKRKKRMVEYEALNETVSGRKIWIQTSLTPILNEQNEITNLIAIDKNITKRKESELEVLLQKEKIELQAKHLEEINVKLERLSIVARKTENAIMIMDAVGNIKWINEFFTKIYGYTFDQFLKKRGTNILQTSFNPEIETVLRNCINTKESVTYEAVNVTDDEGNIWTATTLTPVLNANDKIEYLVTIDTDITKRKLAEAKLNKQNENITDSIKYARKIQKAIMPNTKFLNSVFSEYFILNKPRNIVSGDFYWLKKVHIDDKELIILAVADCTGHGVPGAFVSMLEISLLADIVSAGFFNGNSLSTSEILEKLRKRTKKTFNQKGNSSSTKDGMDLALCIINETDRLVQYSGANNPIYHLKKDKSLENELLVYKPTKNPIGLHLREKKFEQYEFSYNDNDMLYLFSDGIIDQFGGEKGRKFMAKNFKEFLLEISNENMTQQHFLLKQKLKQWQNKYEQVDDILVMGVKL